MCIVERMIRGKYFPACSVYSLRARTAKFIWCIHERGKPLHSSAPPKRYHGHMDTTGCLLGSFTIDINCPWSKWRPYLSSSRQHGRTLLLPISERLEPTSRRISNSKAKLVRARKISSKRLSGTSSGGVHWRDWSKGTEDVAQYPVRARIHTSSIRHEI